MWSQQRQVFQGLPRAVDYWGDCAGAEILDEDCQSVIDTGGLDLIVWTLDSEG